jgi:hypothetical protein
MSITYKENDNVYLNVVFNHPAAPFVGTDSPMGEEPVPAEYNVTKTLPILDNASDYYVSVIRFDIPLDATPLFIMPIIPNQTFPNMSPLIIGVINPSTGIPYPKNITFSSQSTLPAPVQNQSTQVITPYYYVFSYVQMISMINEALYLAWVNAGSPGTPGPDAAPPKAPFFYFNSASSLISIVVNIAFTNGSGAIIFMNAALRNYLDAFNLDFRGFNQDGGLDFYFNFQSPFGPSDQQAYYFSGEPTDVPALYYQYFQDYPTISNWASLRKIIISSNTIPTANEFIPVGSTNGVAASFPILTDFVPSIENAGESRSLAYYVPTSQYRLVDLVANIPLQKIDLKIYWVDTMGNLYPVLISLYQQASVKLAFIRKSLYKGRNQLLYK